MRCAHPPARRRSGTLGGCSAPAGSPARPSSGGGGVAPPCAVASHVGLFHRGYGTDAPPSPVALVVSLFSPWRVTDVLLFLAVHAAPSVVPGRAQELQRRPRGGGQGVARLGLRHRLVRCGRPRRRGWGVVTGRAATPGGRHAFCGRRGSVYFPPSSSFSRLVSPRRLVWEPLASSSVFPLPGFFLPPA